MKRSQAMNRTAIPFEELDAETVNRLGLTDFVNPKNGKTATPFKSRVNHKVPALGKVLLAVSDLTNREALQVLRMAHETLAKTQHHSAYAAQLSLAKKGKEK